MRKFTNLSVEAIELTKVFKFVEGVVYELKEKDEQVNKQYVKSLVTGNYNQGDCFYCYKTGNYDDMIIDVIDAEDLGCPVWED